MTMPGRAEEQALRRAVRTGDFAATEKCARDYTEALAASLPRLSREQSQQLLRDGCAVVEWARRCVCVMRSRCRDKLQQVQRLAAYRPNSQEDRVPTWRIDG